MVEIVCWLRSGISLFRCGGALMLMNEWINFRLSAGGFLINPDGPLLHYIVVALSVSEWVNLSLQTMRCAFYWKACKLINPSSSGRRECWIVQINICIMKSSPKAQKHNHTEWCVCEKRSCLCEFRCPGWAICPHAVDDGDGDREREGEAEVDRRRMLVTLVGMI